MKLLQGFLFLFLIYFAASAYSLEGWTVSEKGGLRIYYPNDIQRGKVFMYVASGPYDLNGADLKQWFSRQALHMQNRLGKPLQKWIVKPNKDNWLITNRYVDKKRGVTVSIGYRGGMLDKNCSGRILIGQL